MSVDNRSMLRKKGWFLTGHRPIFKGTFRRGTRLSTLSFLDSNGIFECFQTNSTFNRLKFFEYCKQLLDSGKVETYPGRRSVWILDGAAIHVDPCMIDYFHLRSFTWRIRLFLTL
eukprot:Pompholyxophrys_punicea_v1_NODE_778_length_1311_cov_2.330414.p1 type:complete len:115 gc:universal NODE_778_length_1311_cov_2.330414:730-1074(+)